MQGFWTSGGNFKTQREAQREHAKTQRGWQENSNPGPSLHLPTMLIILIVS